MRENIIYYSAAVFAALLCAACFALFSGNGCVGFLRECGWEVDAQCAEYAKINIPCPFDEIYRSYNELQKRNGFDLEPYAGKRCERFTYRVLNYPDLSEEVRANVFVYKGSVIGGDICTLNLGGFMHGLREHK